MNIGALSEGLAFEIMGGSLNLAAFHRDLGPN